MPPLNKNITEIWTEYKYLFYAFGLLKKRIIVTNVVRTKHLFYAAFADEHVI